jgi:hypothetical protein
MNEGRVVGEGICTISEMETGGMNLLQFHFPSFKIHSFLGLYSYTLLEID